MLPSTLPLVPFAIQPRKEWDDRMEKKVRVPIIYDSDDEEEMPEDSPEEDDDDDESLDTIEDIQARIRSMLIENPDGGPPIYVDKEYKGDQKQPNSHNIFTYPCRRFMQWRRNERERRVHYIIRDYERKVKEYDEMLKKQMQDEIESEEKAVMLEAYRAAKRIKSNNFKRRNKMELHQRYIDNVNQRIKEQARIDFNVYTLQRWATERHEEKLKAAQDLEGFLLQKKKLDNEQQIIKDRKAKKKADARVLKDDVAITQETMRIMRQGGDKEGVNAAKHEVKKEKVEDRNYIEIRLKENVDFGDWKKKKTDATEIEPFYPFDEDLQTATTARHLVARYIGERGALCLASEFVRGACPRLEILDVSHCGIKTRGAGRLLHGVKLGRLSSLSQLVLRGNDLTPQFLEFLKVTFDSGILLNLQLLDLRENELGDEGADTIMRMIIGDYFQGITELRLQRNGIGEKGFVKIIKALQSLHERKCPRLIRCGLEGNNIAADAKRKYSPLPACVSV